MIRLLTGDARELLKTLPDESVNCCVTSPPYAGKRTESYSAPVAGAYVEWFTGISAELLRTLNDGGSLILNLKEGVSAGQRERYVYELVLAMCEQGWRWVDEFIWHKIPSYPGKWPNRFRDAFERCYHFTKSPKFAMYQDAVMVPVGEWHDTRDFDGINDSQRMESVSGSGMGRRRDAWRERRSVYPSNVLTGSPEYNVKFHPAPYPVYLPEFFIKLFTIQGDTILDPFSGAGSTAIAAARLQRNYIGIELNKNYVEMSKNRIEQDAPMFNEVQV